MVFHQDLIVRGEFIAHDDGEVGSRQQHELLLEIFNDSFLSNFKIDDY